MVFHWILSDSKSPQVSRTLFSNLDDLNNAVVWIVFTRIISKSSSSLNNLLGIILNAPITIGITVTFIFYSFFSSLAKSMYLSLFAFFYFYSVVFCDGKVCYLAGSLSFLDYHKFWPRLGDLFASQNPRELCASHSP